MVVFHPPIKAALALIALITLSGTIYSYRHGTFLDTSNPLLAHLPHPHSHVFFANKKNVLNQLFVKKAWGWTSLAFWVVWFSGGATADIPSVKKWASTTLVWFTFAGWFFGPSLFHRIGMLSGMECVVTLPPGEANGVQTLLTIPTQFCSTRTPISPETHPALFVHPPQSFSTAEAHFPRMPAWKGDLQGLIPKFYRGHDVSGHTFLLTLSVLFLVDHLVRTRRFVQGNGGLSWTLSSAAAWALVGLWMVMLGATAVYFHTWQEKLSGFLIAVVSFYVSQYPFDREPREEVKAE